MQHLLERTADSKHRTQPIHESVGVQQRLRAGEHHHGNDYPEPWQADASPDFHPASHKPIPT